MAAGGRLRTTLGLPRHGVLKDRLMMNVPSVTDGRGRIEYITDMDCTKCAIKGCRDGTPCTDRSALYASDCDQAEVSVYTGTAPTCPSPF